MKTFSTHPAALSSSCPSAREVEQPAEKNVVMTIELPLTWEIEMPIILWLLGVPLIAVIVLMLLGVVQF
jgi:hypothetical protein